MTSQKQAKAFRAVVLKVQEPNLDADDAESQLLLTDIVHALESDESDRAVGAILERVKQYLMVHAPVQPEQHYFEGYGDRAALLVAIAVCLETRSVAPQWVVKAYLDAINKWFSMEVKNLGDAFGVAMPKGKHLNAMKKRLKLKPAVFDAVLDASNRGRAIDDELFEEIGGKLGLGKTLVKQYYKEAIEEQPCRRELFTRRQRREK